MRARSELGSQAHYVVHGTLVNTPHVGRRFVAERIGVVHMVRGAKSMDQLVKHHVFEPAGMPECSDRFYVELDHRIEIGLAPGTGSFQVTYDDVPIRIVSNRTFDVECWESFVYFVARLDKFAYLRGREPGVERHTIAWLKLRVKLDPRARAQERESSDETT